MISLFSDEEQSVELAPKKLCELLRSILLAHLDKGRVPSAEEMNNEVKKKYPQLTFTQSILIGWFESLVSGKWLSEMLTKDLFEVIGHGPGLIETLTPHGKYQKCSPIEDNDWNLFIELIAHKNQVSFNEESPFASFYLAIDGSHFRCTLQHPSLSANNQGKFFLRQLQKKSPDLCSYFDKEEDFKHIQNLLLEKKNIIIAGSTGSGKTTFLSSCLKEIPEEEHIMILEDTHEILSSRKRYTKLLAQEGNERKSLKKYMTYAMRMSPERIIIGEMRSNEVVPFILAMNTGHKGLMSTIHASSAFDTLHRVAQLFTLYSEQSEINYEQVLSLVCRNIDHVIFLEDKKIKEVITIYGFESNNPIYETIF